VRHVRLVAAGLIAATALGLVAAGCSDDAEIPTATGRNRPLAVIELPVAGDATLTTARPCTLEGHGEGSSGEDLYPEHLRWYLDEIAADGLLGTGERLERFLPAGDRTIYLVADEAPDRADTASVEVTIALAANHPPTCRLLEPLDGDDFLPAHVPTTLRGEAADLESGALDGAQLSWRSSLDGELGTGAELAIVLSPGEHRLIVTATDPDDASLVAADTVTVVLQHRPGEPVAGGEVFLDASGFAAVGDCAAVGVVVGAGTLAVDGGAGTAAFAIVDVAGPLACDPGSLCALDGVSANGNVMVSAAGIGGDGVQRELAISLYRKGPGVAEGLLRLVETEPGQEPCVQRSRVVLLATTI